MDHQKSEHELWDLADLGGDLEFPHCFDTNHDSEEEHDTIILQSR